MNSIEVMGIGGKLTEEQVIVSFTISDDIIISADFSAKGNEFLVSLSETAKELIINKGIDNALCLSSAVICEKYMPVSDEQKKSAHIVEEAIKRALGDYYTKKGIFEEEKSNCCCCGK